jgi:hypothetical protein
MHDSIYLTYKYSMNNYSNDIDRKFYSTYKKTQLALAAIQDHHIQLINFDIRSCSQNNRTKTLSAKPRQWITNKDSLKCIMNLKLNLFENGIY